MKKKKKPTKFFIGKCKQNILNFFFRFFFFLKFISLRERAREHKLGEEQKDKENPKQTLW